MKKIGVGSLMLAVCAANVFAADFPYGVTGLATRHETNNVTLASFSPVSVPKVNGGMPSSDSVAEVLLVNAAFTALDDDGWVESTNELAQGSVPQAAFTLKEEGDTPTYKWMGFTGGEWREFTGVAAAPGAWDVKIELDYSLSFDGGTPKIRYLVREGGSTGDYTALKADDAEWVAIGNAERGYIDDVQLSGYCTVGSASAASGARGVDGTVTKLADVSLNYSNLSVNVEVANTWGATNLEIVVKNAGGQSCGTKNVALTGAASYDVDLTEYVQAGESYTYAANLTGGYNGSALPDKPDASPNTVDLFATIDWFRFADSTFVRATTNNLVVENGAFHVDDDESEGVVTPTTSPSAIVSTEVVTTIDVIGSNGDMPAFESGSEPQFAVALGGDDSARVWKYYNGSTKAWADSPTVGLPTTNGVYVGRATFNYTSGFVTYEIRPADETSYATLVENCTLPSGKTSLAAVAISGGGNVSAMNATCKLVEPAAPTVDGSTITVATNAKLDLGDLSGTSYSVDHVGTTVNGHLSWTDANGKYATLAGGTLTIHSGTPANGMESFHSYVLGLDPDVATDVPAAVVGSLKFDNDGISVKVPNVTPTADTGCTPKLQLQRSSDGTSWETVSVHDIDAEVKIPLTDPYRYRVNTIIQ